MTSIKDHGAVGDGQVLDSPAIQRAIDAAAEAGGGRVTVPAGIYRCGTIRLRSHIELFLKPGAVIRASHDLADYPAETTGEGLDTVSHFGMALIRAENVESISITGGTFDGQGPAFWEPSPGPRKWIPEKHPRVSPMFEFGRVKDLRLTDMTILDSPGWTVHLFCCDRVWIRGIRLDNNLFGPNTDGLDINGCRDVMVSDCHISCGDDAIVLKTTKEARSCERVVVTNCILRSNCVAFKLGTESWHDFRQITFSNSVAYQSSRLIGLFALDGGTMEQVRVDNISGDTNCGFAWNRPIHMDASKRVAESGASTIRDVTIRNLSAITDGRVILTAADGCTIEDVTIDGLSLKFPVIDNPDTEAARRGKSIQCSRHSPEARVVPAAIVADGIKRLRLTNLGIRWPKGPPPEDWLTAQPGGLHDPEGDKRHVAKTFERIWSRDLEEEDVEVSGKSAWTV
ncbi:MAG: glycoside hydrolase family 28 protein [Oceanipulchritudo sp.]